jgi:hypothetical protein
MEFLASMVQYDMACFHQDDSIRGSVWLASPWLITYVPGTTKVEAMDEVLHSREQILVLL